MCRSIEGEDFDRLQHGTNPPLEIAELRMRPKVLDGAQAIPRTEAEELTRIFAVSQQNGPGTGWELRRGPGRKLLPSGYECVLLAGVDEPAAVCEKHGAIVGAGV